MPRTEAARIKSPGLAAFLSLFPGLGQVYNGQIARAFVFFFGFVGAIYLTASGHEFPFAFMIPFVYLFNIIDAWKGATAINARFLGGQPEPDDTAVESPLWGASLALFGVLILFNNLGWLDLDRLARWWPLLLIAVGAWFVYASVQQNKKATEATDEPARTAGTRVPQLVTAALLGALAGSIFFFAFLRRLFKGAWDLKPAFRAGLLAGGLIA